MKNPYNFTYDEFMSFLDDAEKKASQKKRHQINESHREINTIDEYNQQFPDDLSMKEFEDKMKEKYGI